MSSAVESAAASRLNTKSALSFDLFFGLLPLILATPMLAVEFRALWSRLDMRFFPVPVLIAIVLVALNLRSPRAQNPKRVLCARSMFCVGVVLFSLSVWRYSPWLAHLSYVVLFAGWAMERFGAVAWSRVIAWVALLATTMRLPGVWDNAIHEWTVSYASAWITRILDGLSIPFLIQADTFSMRDLEFQLTECCAGPYGIHALACLTVIMLLFSHRSFLVAVLSFAALPFWLIVQHTLLLLSTILLQHYNGRDATTGVDQVLIQLAAFGVVAICCWMTMWFMSQMLQPVPAADSQFEPEFLLLNSVLCWPQPDPFAGDVKRANEVVPQNLRSWTAGLSRLMRPVSWFACLVMLASSGIAAQRLLLDNTLVIATRTLEVNENKVNAYAWKETLPATLGRWRQMIVSQGFKVDEGKRRAVVDWQFDWQGQVVEVQLVFPYSSRPDVAKAYSSKGWNVLEDKVQRFATTTKELGIKDYASAPVDGAAGSNTSENSEPIATREWRILKVANELGGRATAIVTYQTMNDVRDIADPNPSALEYQVTLFCESGEELSLPQENELYNTFLNATDQLREKVRPHLSELLGGEND